MFERFITIFITLPCLWITIVKNDKHTTPSLQEMLEREKLYTQKFSGIGPTGMEHNETMGCEEFSQTAKFNPYSVIGEDWIAFYFWATNTHPFRMTFLYPTELELERLHELLDDGRVTLPVNWKARLVLVVLHQGNDTYLLVERSHRGEYWMYLVGVEARGRKIEPVDVRFKQTSDNKYIGMAYCKNLSVFVLARKNDIPRKNKMSDEVAKIGYRSRRGHSYLYQGHEWMPIPEADEDEYWARSDKHSEEDEHAWEPL